MSASAAQGGHNKQMTVNKRSLFCWISVDGSQVTLTADLLTVKNSGRHWRPTVSLFIVGSQCWTVSLCLENCPITYVRSSEHHQFNKEWKSNSPSLASFKTHLKTLFPIPLVPPHHLPLATACASDSALSVDYMRVLYVQVYCIVF